MRSIGGRSEVDTTITVFAMPWGPRLCSMKSFTSRPRSPISATTFTSAVEPRASMPSSVLLPTPGGENTPEQGGTHRAAVAAAGRNHLGQRRDAGGRPERREQGGVALEAHHLGQQRWLAGRGQLAEFAHMRLDARGVDEHAHRAVHAA